MQPTKPRGVRAESRRVSPTAPESKSISAAVWEALESQPGFSEAIDRGAREIAEGRSVPYREVRRRR
jgi:hypothetical protein